MRYSSEWRRIVSRLGRWIDFDNDYKTMDINFMESVWNAFQKIFNRGLVYRGAKVMPYSNGCTTVLSNFEAGTISFCCPCSMSLLTQVQTTRW